MKSEWHEHGGEDFETKVFLVSESVCSFLNDADFVVESFDEAERNFVLWLAVRDDAIPVALDHLGELLVGSESLPLEARTPLIEETSRPAFALIAPELAEGFLEQVRRVEPLVGGEHCFEGLASIEAEVLPMRQQRVLLTLDEAPVFARQADVLGLADLVERIAQMAHHMKLVEQDRGLWRMRVGGLAKWLPHVHDSQANPLCFPGPEPFVELRHAGFGAVVAAKPDGSSADQIADHDVIGVPLADRDLVDADGLGAGPAGTSQLGTYVLLVQHFDGMPVELQLACDILDRRASASSSDENREALCIERIVGQKVDSLALHRVAAPTVHTPDLELQVDARIARRQIADLPRASVVSAEILPAANAAHRFFERRSSVTMRAFGSPKTPRTICCGRNPGKAYASVRRRARLRVLAIWQSCQDFA